MAKLENQLTPGGIEAELSQGVSTDSFNKVQQLTDQYSTEERCLRLQELRESGPEAARQVERERRGEPSRSSPKVDDYSDGQPPSEMP